MDEVLEKQDLQKLTQADTKTLKYPVSLAEMEPVINTFPQKKTAGCEVSLANFPLRKDEYIRALASVKHKQGDTPNSLYQNPQACAPRERHMKS